MTSCCPLPLPIVGNPTGHLMNTLPLGMLVWLLDFFLTININCYRSLLIFFFTMCTCLCICGGGAHACLWRAHTLCSDDSSHKLFLSCPLVGSWIKLRLSGLFGSVSVCHLPGYLISPFFPFQHVCSKCPWFYKEVSSRQILLRNNNCLSRNVHDLNS